MGNTTNKQRRLITTHEITTPHDPRRDYRPRAEFDGEQFETREQFAAHLDTLKGEARACAFYQGTDGATDEFKTYQAALKQFEKDRDEAHREGRARLLANGLRRAPYEGLTLNKKQREGLAKFYGLDIRLKTMARSEEDPHGLTEFDGKGTRRPSTNYREILNIFDSEAAEYLKKHGLTSNTDKPKQAARTAVKAIKKARTNALSGLWGEVVDSMVNDPRAVVVKF